MWCSWVLIAPLFPSTPTWPQPMLQSGMLVPSSPGLGDSFRVEVGDTAGIRWPEVQACASVPPGQSPLSGSRELSPLLRRHLGGFQSLEPRSEAGPTLFCSSCRKRLLPGGPAAPAAAEQARRSHLLRGRRQRVQEGRPPR